jgi:hypothetical protein
MPERPHLPQVASTDCPSDACARFLDALFAITPRDSFVEIRFRTESGMGRAFYGTNRLTHAARAIADHAPRTDVFVGILPRARQASRRTDLIDRGSVLWADCDSPESVAALGCLVPPPSIAVASGTADNRHAYWLLDEPAPLDEVERANRQLASILGSDPASSDAARILRPPSLNHKHRPPAPVQLLHADGRLRHRLRDVVGVVEASPLRRNGSTQPSRNLEAPLLALEPAVYVEFLTGQTVGRDRKTRCPFHNDRTPSFHVYERPADGWFCFGCRRGGSIYDLAGALQGIDPRGPDFVTLRCELATRFALSTSATRPDDPLSDA